MCSEIVWNASSNMLAQQNGKDLVATQSVNRRLLMTKLDTGIGQDMKRVADFYFIIPESFLIAFLYIAFVFLKMKAANLKQTRSSVGQDTQTFNSAFRGSIYFDDFKQTN